MRTGHCHYDQFAFQALQKIINCYGTTQNTATMNSSLLLVLCVALSALSSVIGAPTPAAAGVNFIKCKTLSIKLNEMARDLYHKVESPRVTIDIDEPPVTIRPADTCDPQSLQSNKNTCQSRIILALKNYTRIFNKDGVFKNSACNNWTEDANQIAGVAGHLLLELKEQADQEPLTAVEWYGDALCQDSVERLYSFSIISARVFSFLASPETPNVEMKQC